MIARARGGCSPAILDGWPPFFLRGLNGGHVRPWKGCRVRRWVERWGEDDTGGDELITEGTKKSSKAK